MSLAIVGRSDNMDEIHSFLIKMLLNEPDFKASPRGQPVNEIVCASFTLTDPMARLIASPTRAVNYGFAVGELCWYLRGDEDLATMEYYNRRMPQFSDDGLTLNSAYGARILNCLPGHLVSQWEMCRAELLRDPDSRRAVMVINQPRDLVRANTLGSKDVPCTLAIQLLIRDRRLHMSVTMRSNDVWWGLPYDVFSFTCLQECFMLELRGIGCPVDDIGDYHHHAGSLHLYERHFEQAAEVVRESGQMSAPMKPLDIGRVQTLVDHHEPDIRASGCQELSWAGTEPDAVDWMIERLFEHQRKRTREAQEKK